MYHSRTKRLPQWTGAFLVLVTLGLQTPLTSAATLLRGPHHNSNNTRLLQVDDLRQFLNDEIARGETNITVPPGVYRVTPQNREHLVFDRVDNVVINAHGVEMICTETTRAITIWRCNNFTIKGLTIDFDPLPFSQGRIVSMSNDNTVHEIELFDGYPTSDFITGDKYEIFRPDTRQLRYGSYHGNEFRALSSNHIEVTRRGSYQGEQVGDIIAIGAEYRPGGSIPHAVFLYDTNGVTLEDVTLYTGNMFGFFEDHCTSNHYLRCHIDRRPESTDYTTRADPRIRSLHADAFHSKHATIGPKIEGCRARFMADDAVAINGHYDMVLRAEGTMLHVLGKDNAISVEVGDPLEVVSYTGERLDNANVVSVTPSLEVISNSDLDFLYAQGLHAGYKDSMRSIWIVRIDRSYTSLPRGSLIAPANRMGNGFNVTGNDFGFNRSRGILIKASHGVIMNNKVEGSVMAAIQLAPDYWWLESGSSNDVQIVGNNIEHCGGIGIDVSATGGSGAIAPAGAHNDIVIQNNIVCGTADTPIRVTSTNGLVMENNSIDLEAVLENNVAVIM